VAHTALVSIPRCCCLGRHSPFCRAALDLVEAVAAPAMMVEATTEFISRSSSNMCCSINLFLAREANLPPPLQAAKAQKEGMRTLMNAI